MQRSLDQSVRFTVATVPTSHPAGTVADHWFWEVSNSDGVIAQRQTPVPEMETALPPGTYAVTVRLETVTNGPIGATTGASFEILEQNVTIETAGALSVEVL